MCVRRLIPRMELTEIFQSLGEDRFYELIRTVSISRLKTYQLYESLKTRARVPKLNVQGLRRAALQFWGRIGSGDEDLAADLAQAVLVSNFDMLIEILDFLGVPHQDGFFEKDLDASEILTGDWQERAYDQFREKHPEPAVLFYVNHLAYELAGETSLFMPAGAQ